ncbi:hypothetical protein HRbin21_00123 [bacterium HR21]|nr:hypothetical protein HRbin21_00123 [bacterium HR21]
MWHLGVLLLAVVMGCRSTTPEPPVEGEILLGQGGGFTGMYSGHLLRSDGLVFRWSQMPGQPERTEEAGRVPADSLQPFFRKLARWQQEGKTVLSTGNMVAFLEFRHAGTRYRLQWGLGETNEPEVQELYQELLRFLRRHLP